MAESSLRWYRMTVSELLFIIASLNIKNWYGFTSGEIPRSGQDIHRMMASLWEKEIISFESVGGRKVIKVKEECSDIFSVAANADFCVHAVSLYDMNLESIVYISGDRAALVELDRTNRESVRVISITRSEWPDFILRECLASDMIAPHESKKHAEETSHTLGEHVMTAEEAAAQENVLAVFDRVDINTGMTGKRLMIHESGMERYVTEEDDLRREIEMLPGDMLSVRDLLKTWG